VSCIILLLIRGKILIQKQICGKIIFFVPVVVDINTVGFGPFNLVGFGPVVFYNSFLF
jgi:hypothetical protein